MDKIQAISLILTTGIGSMWLAWKLRIPSIIVLLLVGFYLGPISGILNPDDVLGDLLFPYISISVAIILFEGGLSLKFSEIPGVKSVIFNLISFGLLITWVVATVAGIVFLNLNLGIAVLIGSVITVSGPTVVLPLIKNIRAKAPLGTILKWEGILIDPIGALLAVLVFESLLVSTPETFGSLGMIKTIGFSLFNVAILGSLIGFIFGLFLIFIISKYLIPEFLQSPMALMITILSYALAEQVHSESGLFAVTILGITLANSRKISVHHILEFKENLRVLLIASLFIILAARVKMDSLLSLDVLGISLFLVLIFFISRPLGVLFSTIGSNLNIKEKLLLSWVAPRGIVAAAVASLFQFELEHRGYPDSDKIIPIVFTVILSTVIIYGLTAKSLAIFLDLRQKTRQGILFFGANKFACQLALILKSYAVPVFLVDTNRRNINYAKQNGLQALQTNILTGDSLNQIELTEIGQMLAVTSNREANKLASIICSKVLDKKRLFILPQSIYEQPNTQDQIFEFKELFTKESNYHNLSELLNKEKIISSLKIAEDLCLENISKENKITPLIKISDLKVYPIISSSKMEIKEDDIIIYIEK